MLLTTRLDLAVGQAVGSRCIVGPGCPIPQHSPGEGSSFLVGDGGIRGTSSLMRALADVEVVLAARVVARL